MSFLKKYFSGFNLVRYVFSGCISFSGSFETMHDITVNFI